MSLAAPSIFKRAAYSRSKLRKDVASIQYFYRRQGFLKATVEPVDVRMDSLRRRVAITIAIAEGPRTIVSAVTVHGASAHTSEYMAQLTRSTRIGGPLRIDLLEEDRRAIYNRCADDGFLEAQVDYAIVLSGDSLAAQVAFTVSEGEPVLVGRITAEGNRNVRDRVALRECMFEAGDTLRRKQIRTTVDRLYRTGLFNLAAIRFDADSAAGGDSASPSEGRIVRVVVEEKDFFSFELGGGFHTYEGLRGKGEIGYANLFGLGHKVWMSGNVSLMIRKTELGVTVPWFAGLPVNLDLAASYRWQKERDIYEGTFGETKEGFSGRIGMMGQYYARHRFEDVTLRRSVDQERLSDTVAVKNTNSISAGLIFDSRNDLFEPSSGVYATLDLEVSGLGGGGRANQFVKAQCGLRGCFTLGTPLVFASAVRLGAADTYGADSIMPIQERFFSGGSTTLRGFWEKEAGPRTAEGSPTGGNAFLTLNVLEARFPIYRALSGALFLDAGNVWNANAATLGKTARSIDLNDLRYSAGAGVRVKLPIGIVRFDAGLLIDRRAGDPIGALHVDMGQAF